MLVYTQIHMLSSCPNVMVFVGGAFARCLSPEGGALMNRISALRRETPRELPCHFFHVRTEEEVVYVPGSRTSTD